jgi:hypothetical protein
MNYCFHFASILIVNFHRPIRSRTARKGDAKVRDFDEQPNNTQCESQLAGVDILSMLS